MMNTPYKFTYKRHLFKKSVIVIGHSYLLDQDKMILYFPDGSISEIVAWSKCRGFLGVDWVAAVKAQMNVEAQRSV
jgi:hypothetical protein